MLKDYELQALQLFRIFPVAAGCKPITQETLQTAQELANTAQERMVPYRVFCNLCTAAGIVTVDGDIQKLQDKLCCSFARGFDCGLKLRSSIDYSICHRVTAP